MFKLESYITPIILSYVNRYINNFKPEDSQVSLWGGDATFHNLELNLEVLEQELQLPFSFVSGSIRELSIHVPWTKITSEPIRITINTIECILNLKGKSTRSTQSKKVKEKITGQNKNVEAPPGYIQSLINKIVSNISIHCNNLILKYVEEDIVLSMNVKLLKFESANKAWESAYTDLSPAQVILRKVISVSDLTLCLDKRNASGKIEVYQEPMLYRCSMTIHLLRHYHSATANMASTTRLDVYCNNMEFSMTEQQVPMLIRLFTLLYALHQKHLKPEVEHNADGGGASTENSGESQETGATWTGWAWSYVSSVLPAPWEDEWDQEEMESPRGHTLHLGLYVDRASITFKVSESNQEHGYYSTLKKRCLLAALYRPMLTLDLEGIYSDTLISGLQWFNCTGGISKATLMPVGYCSCGNVEVNESTAPYLKLGSASNFHKLDSLFDADAVENKGGKRVYDTSWDHHMTTTTEAVLLEKTPAFAFDYVYQLEIPSDMSSDIITDLASNYEFSNLSEISALRLCVGPFRLRVCSGLIHRCSTLQVAASFYDYPPYYTPKPDLALQELLPPSEEDFDALNEFIPSRTMRMTFFAPVIELELLDHPVFRPDKGCLLRKNKKSPTPGMPTSNSTLPKLTIECQFIDVSQQYPMYVNRLVHTTCQLPEPPKKLFEACFIRKSVRVVGLFSRLATNPSCHSIILSPSSVSYSSKSILKPQYWINSHIPHSEIVFESENITLNGTKAKMLVVLEIVDKILGKGLDPVGKSIYSSSLLSDACKDFGFPFMEICFDGIRFKKVITNSTHTMDASIGAVKGFIFEHTKTQNVLQQVLFISGPEVKLESTSKSLSEDPPLFTVTVQFPLRPDLQKHPPILVFNLQEIRICIDPLLCKWLLYVPKNFILSDIIDPISLSKVVSFSEASGSLMETPRRLSTNKLESVHSSSDQKIYPKVTRDFAPKEESIDLQEKVYNTLREWFDVWKGMFLSGDVSQCTIYFPMSSLSAIGSQGIQEAVEQALSKSKSPDILVITLPFANVRSSQRQNINNYLKELPVTLPEGIWTLDKSSFPWTMSVSELSCYTLQSGEKLIFLKPVSLSATVGLSTRPSKGPLVSVAPTIETADSSTKTASDHAGEQKRKKLSSSNAQHGKSNSSSTVNSPAKKTPKKLDQKASSVSAPPPKVDIGYLGVCVHIDTTPIAISTSEVQVYLFASILYGLMEVASNLVPGSKLVSSKVADIPAAPLTKGSSTLSLTQLRDTALDNVSDKTPPLADSSDTPASSETDSVKLTAWVQWTITRFTIELLSSECSNLKELQAQPRLKLVIDAEDIVSSLDFQSIYLKVKSKIGSASIQHYERMSPASKWQPGAFSGIVMRLREDLASNQKQEDNSLISITITRASCQHTHTLWGAVQKNNKDKKSEANTQLLSKSRYITEIVVNVQPLDFVVSLSTLRSFYLVLIPLLNIPANASETRKPDTVASMGFLSTINNQTLPLAYLDCQDIRVIMPAKDLIGNGTFYDTVVFQLQKISLNPQAVNPICRTPIRSDIYDQAAHARILNIPGSEVEDRQYQLDIAGISVCTGTWEEMSAILIPARNFLSNLRGLSENPALEWNILEQGQPNMRPSLNLRCIVEKLEDPQVQLTLCNFYRSNSFHVTVVAAPAMVYKDTTILCGHSIEINLVSDTLMGLSLQQIKLLSAIFTEFVQLITPFIMQDGVLKKPKIKFPYSRFDSVIPDRDSSSALPVIQSRDSGIDTSDLKSVQSSKGQVAIKQTSGSDKQLAFPRPPNTIPYIFSSIPIEVVLTAGKIGLTLYSVDDERTSNIRHKGRKKKVSKKSDDDQGYEASEESTDDRGHPSKKYTALLHVCFTQPNAFYSQQQVGRKLQISCFDVNLKLSGPEYSAINRIPTEQDFPINLLETKPGTPNSSNGILPAFFTLRFSKGMGKHSKIELEILKPTKILCQTSQWGHLIGISNKVVDAFKSGGGSGSFMALLEAAQSAGKKHAAVSTRSIKSSETFNKFQQVKDVLGTINSVSVKFDQLIVAISSESGHELHLGMRQLNSHLLLSSRPEKICLTTTFDCLTLTVIYDDFKRLLLNPWTITVETSVFWESWQDSDSNPQVQISAESDCILVDVTAEQLKCLEMVLKDFNEWFSSLPTASATDQSEETHQSKVSEKDQHYKDDLRAGAFQFVDCSTNNMDEMPLPYQVMFWMKSVSAMAWKYPQPRALTKVRVFPVPYKMALNPQDNISVLCHLEYWSEYRNCYMPYTQFCLSESEVCHLNLPDGCPKTVVASTWRVVITNMDESTEEPILNKRGISPRALAACMRIDSYFNRRLIPNLNVAVYLTRLEVSLYNFLPKHAQLQLPECLKKYTSDLAFPEAQKFLTVSLDSFSAYFCSWHMSVWMAELNCSIQSTILDYAHLTEQTFIEPFTSKLELFLSKGLRGNFISKPIQLKFGPSIAHTLAISSQIWTQSYATDSRELDFIITSRYVICNDTNSCIRFGQDGTQESVLLPCRVFHLYSWRSQKKQQQLRLSLESSNWEWSKPFRIIKEGTQMIHFNSDKNFTIFVTVKNVSKTQKQITFFGQLIVCNMLAEHFEMKIMEAAADNKEQEFKNAQSHIVGGKTAAPSIFINNTQNYYLRLRFFGLESAWTGDIPLREHATGSQPWLVKVPLQERGQFLSIWCRIFIQDFVKSKRILAMLWPLFMVKSNLPMSVKIHMETPTLGVHLDSVVNGKGDLQQLYCPGTVDHSHQITFQLDEGNASINDPYIPLNYTLVDHKEFFKKSSKEEIEVILESLNHCFESKWPYFEDELENIDWVMDLSQPLTHVQVRYQNACPYSCALLVEVLPWCLIANSLGTPVSLMLNGVELCSVQHHGIIAPPRLEDNFHLGICTGGNWFFSGPLQLAKSDWSQSFYMPKITGNIPLEGTIRTCIKCDSNLCIVSLTSSLRNEIRLLRFASTHVLSNYLSTQVQVMCFAMPDTTKVWDFPKLPENHCFSVAPHSPKSCSGIPIRQWFVLNGEANSDFLLYMAFSIDPTLGWSCPIRVDKPLVRRAISLQAKDFSIPVVLMAQEVKGQVFLALHNDIRPQLFIENSTNAAFCCGETLPDDSSVAAECEHFRWNCRIAPFSSVYYSMPTLSGKFPELPQVSYSQKVSLAYVSTEGKNLEWSAGVGIVNNNNLFIRVPSYGDIKLTIINTACATILTLESVSQVEISARDIRVRLSLRETEKPTSIHKANKELDRVVKPTHLGVDEDLNGGSSVSNNEIASGSQWNRDISQRKTEDSSARLLAVSSKVRDLFVKTLPLRDGWESIQATVYIKSFGITLLTDKEEDSNERWELASLICDDVIVTAKQTEQLVAQISLSDIQLDNQLYARESFDFPVVLIGQERKIGKRLNMLNTPIETLLENCGKNPLIITDLALETWANKATGKTHTGVKTMKVTINPISCFVEDIYLTRLNQYMKDLNIIHLVIWPNQQNLFPIDSYSRSVCVPELIAWQCALLAKPLTIRTFVVSPVSLLLSVHSSMKMFIALDQSPLQFGKFERRRLFTTSYRLGHALTMHYLSGAIFGAGWVVSSLELLGSPGGLARAMGTGLRDFLSLPYRGLVQGPMAFLKGITTGSASLMKHVTAGTLQSVTKLASSVARNLDRLTLDGEHQKRTEEQRRQRPQGVAQGFMQGMTCFGISLLGAVGGIAHHPLQSMMSPGASPRSLAAGVGLGIVGVFTKPLSGAAELLALTGQGLLQGAGWNSLPDPRKHPQILHIQQSKNSTLKYSWKLAEVSNSHLLFVTEAISVSQTAIQAPVALILDLDTIVVVNLDTDEVEKVLPLSEISLVHNSDPTVLSLKYLPKTTKKLLEKSEDELAVNMDPEMRARVADYVKSTVGLLNPRDDVSVHSGISISPLSSPGSLDEEETEGVTLHFYTSSDSLKYFVCLLNLAAQQRDNYHFSVL